MLLYSKTFQYVKQHFEAKMSVFSISRGMPDIIGGYLVTGKKYFIGIAAINTDQNI
jgi:hypothetical protein